jgi:mono/diheme cytochrome c family protein
MTRLWFLLPAAVASLGGTVMAQDAAPTFPTGAGQAEVQAACAACHPPAIVASKRYDADKWAEVVDQMIGKGAKVSDADYDVIVAYLARTYGVGK